jgi:hypothetical protein
MNFTTHFSSISCVLHTLPILSWLMLITLIMFSKE